ncbi:hypothetical protein RhiirA5_414380 [Rhizophagus irregularis]|uniref:Uncharacterized protein n=1 Tax=Rhizophagus irregularis TaxID=588596 RepID=A0A2N0S7K8_9GLOM|nr:hypothetical protein RhiirA5_414380 [Rhizophagus irregularis]PKC71529.1 hypothetical protein RhiirA1_453442 [Rhizophagus irregularis]GET53557.1 hypothetical protein GLOIN_2v1578556 [Rhizophagus irregularis DAOM 181602=DAOM 197198]
MLTDGRSPQTDIVIKSEHSQTTSQILEEYKKLLNCQIPLSITKNYQKVLLYKGLLLCEQLRFLIKVYPILPDVAYIHDVVRTLSIVVFKPREKLLGEPSIF